MSELMIDRELLRDLIRELRAIGGGECLKLCGDMGLVACTRARGHDGPCAHACDKVECPPIIDGTVAELLLSLYDESGEHCRAEWHNFYCTRSKEVPHKIHVAHAGSKYLCTKDGWEYAVWRVEEAKPGFSRCSNVDSDNWRCAWPDGHICAHCWIPGQGKPDTGPSKVSAVKPLGIDLRLAADSAYRFFAGLHLQDQPLAVQREARDVLQALGRALRGEDGGR